MLAMRGFVARKLQPAVVSPCKPGRKQIPRFARDDKIPQAEALRHENRRELVGLEEVRLGVAEQRFETVVHVLLDVAMK